MLLETEKLNNQPQNAENTDVSKLEKQLDREFLVSWLFLVGSVMFTLDAVIENLRGISFSSLLHLSASILFTIGSALFIPSNQQK